MMKKSIIKKLAVAAVSTSVFLSSVSLNTVWIWGNDSTVTDETDKDLESKINESLKDLSLEDRVSMMSGGTATAGAGVTKKC